MLRPLILLALVTATPALAETPIVEHTLRPSVADPNVRQFDDISIALAQKDLPAEAPLALFLPGTNGKPEYSREFLKVIAEQGYRVLGLEYDDTPAVVQVCNTDPDPTCAARFRAMRIYGTGPGATGVTNPVAEAIVPRMVAALKTLDRAAPGEGWGGYLDGDTPRWDRIVLSGLSQGAGMAAFMAKSVAVRRVVLFSSPWDFTPPPRRLAPWIAAGPSATPASRWYAEYHKRENTAGMLAVSYRQLQIPPDHVLVFDRDLPAGRMPASPNPFHGSTIRDQGYAPQWRVLYGKASDPVQ